MENPKYSFRCTKTYGHEQGWSCAFRQWRAEHSRCQLLHGYAISVRLEFKSETLDDRRWVQDFGSLRDVKARLVYLFDHTTVIAHDDPALPKFQELSLNGIIDLRILKDVGCESFAKEVYDIVSSWLSVNNPRVCLSKVEVHEHAGNSAAYIAD